MSLQCGSVGLPNVLKFTLFNALTQVWLTPMFQKRVGNLGFQHLVALLKPAEGSPETGIVRST